MTLTALRTIPVLKPSCTEAEVQAVADVLRSSWWGEGPRVREFEERLALLYLARDAVAVNSCTSALLLALRVLGIGPGDEVILPALTFVSDAVVCRYLGARPVFADVLSDTLCLDPEDVQRKRTPKTKAAILVDYAGFPAVGNDVYADLPLLHHPAYKGLALIQDAAHSAGGRMYGDLMCLSFHPVKNLATGDGGAVVVNDREKGSRMRALRWCGIDMSTWARSGKRYKWDYDIAEIGYKSNWNDVQAAIGLAQLSRLDAMNQRRRQIAERYTHELRDLIQTPADHRYHTWHLYVARVDADRRDALIDGLAERGIGTGVHYKPLTYYKPFAGDTPPVTEREWRRLVSLPIYADLTDDDQTRVIAGVREVLGG